MSQLPRPSACPLGTQANGLDFPKQPVPVGGAISTAQAQAFFGHLHQVGRPVPRERDRAVGTWVLGLGRGVGEGSF